MFQRIRNVMIFLLCFVCYLCSSVSDVETYAFAQTTEMAKQVILGGEIVGFEYAPCGVLVVSVNEQSDKLLKVGDLIKAVDDEKVSNSSQISSIINKKNGEQVKLNILREGKEMDVDFVPRYDLLMKKFVLGVWVKGSISGVGTITYINPSTGYFGSLGHPITTNGHNYLPVKEGKIYSCDVVGITKGFRGNPGAVKGVILKSHPLGKVLKNTEYGVFGTADVSKKLKKQPKLVDVGGKKSIKPGNAQIYCSLNDGEIGEYDIQIIKTNYQDVSNGKSFVFKVTDKNLISKTGGIVQGMSGSPIVQNGKLVGAVTHVFTNDSTKGFGIYIDWML